MYMNEKMDEGDIILQEETEIGENETTGELWDRLKEQGAELLLKTIKEIEKGTAPRTPQGDNFTIAPMLKKEMAKIDFMQTAEEIKNLVRGLNPIMGAYSMLQGKKLKVWKVEIQKLENFIKKHQEFETEKSRVEKLEPGTIIYIDSKEGVYIKAKDGIVILHEVQAENSRRMTISEYLNGNQMQAGQIFE